MDTDTDNEAYDCEDSSRCSDAAPTHVATILGRRRRPSALSPARKRWRRRGRRGRRGRGRDQPHVRVRPAAPHNSSTYIMDSHSQEETSTVVPSLRPCSLCCTLCVGCYCDASDSDGDLFGDLDVDGSFFGSGGPYPDPTSFQLPPLSPRLSLSSPRFSLLLR